MVGVVGNSERSLKWGDSCFILIIKTDHFGCGRTI